MKLYEAKKLAWREWLRTEKPTVKEARKHYPYKSNPKKTREVRRRYLRAVIQGLVAN